MRRRRKTSGTRGKGRGDKAGKRCKTGLPVVTEKGMHEACSAIACLRTQVTKEAPTYISARSLRTFTR